MKLIDLEDGAQIVTKDYLDTRLDRLQISFDKLENRFDKLENKVDSRFNHLEARINKLDQVRWLIWVPVAASLAQIITAYLK
jgi:hypothetical protein